MGDVFTRSVKDFKEWEADLKFYRLLAKYLTHPKDELIDELHSVNQSRNCGCHRSKEDLVSWLEKLKNRDLESWVRLVSCIGYDEDLSASQSMKLKYLELSPTEIYNGGSVIDLRLPKSRQR